VRAGKFPKPISLTSRTVGWLARDIVAWQQRRRAEAEQSAA